MNEKLTSLHEALPLYQDLAEISELCHVSLAQVVIVFVTLFTICILAYLTGKAVFS